MTRHLISRVEFRAILRRIVGCLRDSLPASVSPLTPEEMHFWLQEITLEDIQVVASEIDLEHCENP